MDQLCEYKSIRNATKSSECCWIRRFLIKVMRIQFRSDLTTQYTSCSCKAPLQLSVFCLTPPYFHYSLLHAECIVKVALK